jgi:hypothetical protein
VPLGGRVAARKRHLAPQMALLYYNMLMDSFNDTAPTESPTVAPKSNKKQGGKIALFTIIALLVGGGIASAIFVAVGYLNQGNHDNRVANCDKNEIENIAVEPVKDDDGNEIAGKSTILDARLTAELAYKTNRIIANIPSSERSPSMDTTGSFDDYINLSDQMRADLVIGSKIFDDSTMETIPATSLPDSYEYKETALNYGDVNIIRIDDSMKSEYKYLFDKELTSIPDSVISDFNTRSCSASYLKEVSYYVVALGCGGGTDIGHSMYQYKYELEGEKAYVYFAVMAKNGYGNETTFYSGFIKDNKVLDIAADQKDNITNVRDLLYNPTDKSYTPLRNIVSHYRAVFEKGSDGDFYYKTLERVND